MVASAEGGHSWQKPLGKVLGWKGATGLLLTFDPPLAVLPPVAALGSPCRACPGNVSFQGAGQSLGPPWAGLTQLLAGISVALAVVGFSLCPWPHLLPSISLFRRLVFTWFVLCQGTISAKGFRNQAGAGAGRPHRNPCCSRKVCGQVVFIGRGAWHQGRILSGFCGSRDKVCGGGGLASSHRGEGVQGGSCSSQGGLSLSIEVALLDGSQGLSRAVLLAKPRTLLRRD